MIHQCSKIDFTKTALQDEFVSYYFKKGKVFNLEEEVVLLGRSAGEASVTSMSANPLAIFAVYQPAVSRVTLESVNRAYNE